MSFTQNTPKSCTGCDQSEARPETVPEQAPAPERPANSNTAEAAGFTVGDHVTYKPTGEAGRIIRFSHQPEPTFCFVKYGNQQHAKATHLKDLERNPK